MTTNNPRKIKPDGRLYRQREREVRELYAVPIVACKHCGSPRHAGFKCTYCDEE
jgi:hypothetical protein